MSTDRQPGAGVSRQSLDDALGMLTHMADLCIEEEETVPSWIVAARRAVQAELRRRGDDD